MSLKLHHLNASRSQRLIWLMEELGLDYEIVHYQRDAETRLAPETLLDIHPMGKSPLLEHDGTIIAETGAIAEYLLAKFDPDHTLHPSADSSNFARYIEWVHAAEGAPFLPFLFAVYTTGYGHQGGPLDQKMESERIKAGKFIEDHLSQNDYFAGDQFTAADCLMGFNIAAALGTGKLGPASAKWLEKVSQRQAYKKMIEIGI